MLTLYKKDSSPTCRAVFMVIRALNISNVEYINVDLAKREQFTEDFIKLNPQHTVPVLKHGDLVIPDSHAVAGYLVNVYGKDDSLYPKEATKRALVDHRLHLNSGILFATLRYTLEPILYHKEKAFRQENLEKIEQAYGIVEKLLTGIWMAGDDVTVADICCVATISSMNEIKVIDKKLYPKVIVWWERCSQQDFYQSNLHGLKLFKELLSNFGLYNSVL